MSIVIDPASLGARVVQLRSVKYDGSLNYLWPARVLSRDAHGFIWATPAGTPFTRPTQVQPVPYDWIGRIWYARWYAVDASLTPARIAGAAGVLDRYYCNIGMPGAWEGDVFRYVDLDLDVLIAPDGGHQLLDEEEFAAHRVRFGYPDATVEATRRAAREAVALAQAGEAPFDGTLAAYHIALHQEGEWQSSGLATRD